MLHRIAVITTLFASTAVPVWADTGLGLFIANQTYDAAPAARRADPEL